MKTNLIQSSLNAYLKEHYFKTFTFSFSSSLFSFSLTSVEAISADGEAIFIEYKGASYSRTVPRNLVDSSLLTSSLCLKRRRGSYDFYEKIIPLII